MPNNDIPEWIKHYLTDNAYTALKEHIKDLEPQSRDEMILKYIALKTIATLTLKLNGDVIGEYNGENPIEVRLNLGKLEIQKNGSTVDTFDGKNNKAINIQVPVITYGAGLPSGGNNGDVYMRYE